MAGWAQIVSKTPIIEFGETINNNIQDYYGDTPSNIVLDKEKLTACYPIKLSINFKSDNGMCNSTSTLYAHFCQSLHMYKSSITEYENWINTTSNKGEDYKTDERVIFVSTQEEG